MLPSLLCSVKVTTPLAKFLSTNAHGTPQKFVQYLLSVFSDHLEHTTIGISDYFTSLTAILTCLTSF